jgi:PTS system nitrogen regulatory IIA component
VRGRIAVLLTELLPAARVKVPLCSRSKDEVLRELVELLGGTGAVSDVDRVLDAVRDRERELPTAIGSGVAIPHGKADEVGELAVAAGVAETPVDYDAPDGCPVSVFFLVVGPESAAGPHLKALSGIARLVRQVELRERLASARTVDEFLATVAEAEGA